MLRQGPGAGSSSPSPSTPKSAKPNPGKKPPPPPPADPITLRTKPRSALGQLNEKSWVADYVAPFDPAAPVKHVTTPHNDIKALNGTVIPVVGDRGVDLLVTWDKNRALLGPASTSIAPLEFRGRLAAAVLLPSWSAPGVAASRAPAAPMVVGLDEERRHLVLLQSDASRGIITTARVPDPTRGHFTLARRVDAPGAALIWYSTTSGDVFAAPVDFGRAEVSALVPLARLTTLTDGGLPACTAKPDAGTPVYDFILDLGLSLKVHARSGKTLLTEGASPSSVLVRASGARLCVTGVEVRGSGRPVDLTATFGKKGAAVTRFRASPEDPTKLAVEKLSCILKEPESR
ncbi:MAG: hypothetical protein R3F14_00545 [Polyangiaceae bacterium]